MLTAVASMLRPTGRGPEVAEIPPTHCPNGHRLRGGLVWVRHSPCRCSTGGHRSYQCRQCGVEWDDPPCTNRAGRTGQEYGR